MSKENVNTRDQVISDLKQLQMDFKKLNNEKNKVIREITKIDEQMFKAQGSFEALKKVLESIDKQSEVEKNV